MRYINGERLLVPADLKSWPLFVLAFGSNVLCLHVPAISTEQQGLLIVESYCLVDIEVCPLKGYLRLFL